MHRLDCTRSGLVSRAAMGDDGAEETNRTRRYRTTRRYGTRGTRRQAPASGGLAAKLSSGGGVGPPGEAAKPGSLACE